MTPSIQIQAVEKRFGPSFAPSFAPRFAPGFAPGFAQVRAVDGVTLAIPQGGVMAIVGESGCGKSTLARLILGLMPPTAGTIHVEGQSLPTLDRRARARLIQPIFQDPYSSLNPRQRIRDIVALPLRAQNHPNPGPAALAMLDRVGLASMATHHPAELSGGQRQRVAIARALVLRPRIVVCDEPTSALDVSVQAQILNLLEDLRAEFALTLVFISHNLAVVEHIATEVAVMYLGRIVEHAPVTDLFATPKHPYTKALLASVLTPEPGLGLPPPSLADTPPDPANIPPGCRLHPRCPVAIPRCATQSPANLTSDGRLVECLLTAN